MQKPQEDGESLSSSKHLPSFTPVESPNIESAPKSSPGLFLAFENASLTTQQLVIASTATVVSALAVLTVNQISIYTVHVPGSTALSQLTAMGLPALIAGVTVGVTILALGRITTNRINRTIDNLQAQFKAVAQGNLGVQVTVDSPQELRQLAISFNQMTQSLNTRLNQAKEKAEEQKEEKDALQQKLIQVSRGLELTVDSDLTLDSEVTISEDEEQAVTPQGSLLDFLDNLHNWFRITTSPDLLTGSSSLEELKDRKEELLYRQAWLQALQDETARELQFLSVIGEPTDQEQVRETREGEKVV